MAPKDYKQLCELAKTRARLYKLSVVFNVLSIVCFIFFAFVLSTDAVVPRWRWLPGFLETIVDFVAKYPWHVFLVIMAIWLIRRATRWGIAGEQELAFQAWQRTAVVGERRLASSTPSIGIDVKFIKRVAPPRWLTCTGVVGFLLLLTVEWGWCQCTPVVPDIAETKPIGCNNIRGLCQLDEGETVRVTISANRVRNETGLLLKSNATYTARYMKRDGWYDGEIEAPPTGFEFRECFLGLPCFWWIEWRQPYPEGLWFQVLGRIDRRREVFQVLDINDASQPFFFNPPSDGELVVFVNDVRYSNNLGVMIIEISRLDPLKQDEGN